MNLIMKMFDYAFYRITKAYMKWDGPKGSTAIFGVTLAQSMIILDVLLIFFLEVFTKDERMNFKPFDKIVVVTILLLILFINFRLYKGKYYFLDEKWKNETKKQKIVHGILVILLILLPLAFPAILVNVRDYTK